MPSTFCSGRIFSVELLKHRHKISDEPGQRRLLAILSESHHAVAAELRFLDEGYQRLYLGRTRAWSKAGADQRV